MSGLPSGTVTMVFSDVEGSTLLLSRSGHRYAEIQDGQRAVQRAAWTRWNGHELATEGDSFFTVFAAAGDAVMAALEVQRELATRRFATERVRVRVGIHTGEPVQHGRDYIGMDVHRAARIASAAHGGQIVISAVTRDLVAGRLGDEVELTDLGQHRLKDLVEPEHLFQVAATTGETESDFPPLRSLGAASRLPAPTTALVGRDHELRELQELLREPDVRLITLLGPAGSGKTRLAIALASSLAEFADSAYFASLANETTREGMWTTIAGALGVGGDAWDPSHLQHTIEDQRALLVLDNLEQIPDAPKVVAEMMSTAPHLVVLVTSRRPLHLHGEHEWPVPPLSLPQAASLGEAERSEAVRLFVHQARLARPSFALSQQNFGAVTEICRRLDGLPLAIELAASRIKVLSPQALLARLDQTLGLRAGDIDRPTRQQTLYSAIEWSYNLLPTIMRRDFRQFGVFAGVCDLDAITPVVEPASEALDLVAELVDVSLLATTEAPDGEPRIGLLQTIAEFARERLVDAGEIDAARRRHAMHYLDVAEAQADELWTGLHQLAAKDRLAADYDNIITALGWALATGASHNRGSTNGLALRLAGALWQFWLMTDRITEGRTWLERALADGEGQDARSRARALSGAGTLAWRQGDFETATARHAAALALQQEIDDRDGAAFSINNLAVQAIDQGDYEKARQLLDEALQLTTDLRVNAIVLLNYGEVAKHVGDHERAAWYQEQALDRSGELGDEWLFCYLSLNLGLTALVLNDPQQATEWFRGGITRVHRLRSSALLAAYLDGLAALALATGRPERGARLFGAAIALHNRSDAGLDVSDSATREATSSAIRAAVGEDAFAQLLVEGGELDVDGAVQCAREILRSSRAGPV